MTDRTNPSKAIAPFAMVPISLIDAGLGPYAVATYAALRAFRNSKSGKAWPAIPTLAARVGCGQTRTRKALRQLEEAGFIVAIRRQNPHTGAPLSTCYTFPETPRRVVHQLDHPY